MLELVVRILIYGVITLTPGNRILFSGFKIITTGTRILLSKDILNIIKIKSTFKGKIGDFYSVQNPFSREFSTLEIGSLISSLPWLLPVLLIVVLPGIYAVMWGTPHLNPGIAGLFFMTEIIVGSSTAAILADEPFGPREITGIILITLAGLTETIGRSVTRFVRVLFQIEK